MIRLTLLIRLLGMPILWMGVVQIVFGELSIYVFHDVLERYFTITGLTASSTALLLLGAMRRHKIATVTNREAILYVVLTWWLVGFLGAIPIMQIADLSFTDAAFESISALTTTGATVLSGLDEMPKSFLLYRQFLQWMGGLGVVIFVVAVLPMLNIGGMKLLKAETPGPFKDEKIAPRVKHTAHFLWYVYLSLTIACALSYWLAGMSAYDAIAHSFTTVSTGGFSTYDASMGHFDSELILWLANLFMLAGAISFALHYRVFSMRSCLLYLHDEECRSFLVIVLAMSLVVTLMLSQQGLFDSLFTRFTQATFHIVSFITSTGYGATGFTQWGGALPLILVFVGYIGGCAGSTAGGNKIIRNVISVKSIFLETKQLVHPNGVFTLKFQGRPIPFEVRNSIMAYMCLAAVTTMVLTILVMMTGMSFTAAFTGVAACLNVLGPGFGELGSNFAPLSDTGTWIMSFAMILGRLEYFTVLAIASPLMWRE